MPAGNKLVWMSSMRSNSTFFDLKADYWMMDLDGANKNQLTWFNDARGPDYMPDGVVAGDSAWSADGSRLAAYLVVGPTTYGNTGKIVMLDLEPAATIVSAASFARPPVAPDAIVSIFGTSLAAGAAGAVTLPLPMVLAGTSVTIKDAAGTERQAPLFYVSPQQINCAIPAGTRPGPAVFTVTNGVGVQSRATVAIELAAPGVFSADASGRGVAAAYAQRFSGSAPATQYVFDCSGGSCAPVPIDMGGSSDEVYLILFGTGIRNRTGLGAVSARAGGQTVEVQYAGPQNVYEGLDQINLKLPRSLAGAGLVDIELVVDGVPANVVQVRIK
jgi:uncharacterized protein (TIGR03437 family)